MTTETGTPCDIFRAPDALAHLEALTVEELDRLDLGVVRMALEGVVVAYNTTEARLSGLTQHRVIGRRFFESVAPCTNNKLVSGRFANEPELDATIAYVFALKLRPTPVRLRLLRSSRAQFMYLIVEAAS